MNFIIGVDIGTSGTKAIAFSSEAQIMANAYVSYNALIPAAGYHEQDPEILFNAVVSCIQQVAAQTASKMDGLKGICFSAAMHSLIAVDAGGQPLTNMITWADARSAAYAEALKKTPLGHDIYKHTGTPIHPMSPLCKLMWLRDHQPNLFAATEKFISIKEYIFFRLFHQYLVDHSIASSTGLFDIYTNNWYTPALQAAGITADRLSQPVSATHTIQGLLPEWVNRLGIPAATPFIVGASDGCLANLGSNATRPGDMAITIGTSGAVRMLTTTPAYDNRERIFNYILQEHLYVAGGAINNGIAVLKWYAQHCLQHPFTSAADISWFMEQAAQAPAGADGLLFLPYILGERAPVWDAVAKGVFMGVHAGHTQAHFMRAIAEGINYALYQVAESVQETVGAALRIFASGGFINSSLWLQWLSDVFGKTIQVINKEDASSIGAAMMGLQATGIWHPQAIDNFFHVQQQFHPNAANHALHRQYYQVYTSLYKQLQAPLHTLNTIRLSVNK
jgi:gluconokinase